MHRRENKRCDCEDPFISFSKLLYICIWGVILTAINLRLTCKSMTKIGEEIIKIFNYLRYLKFLCISNTFVSFNRMELLLAQYLVW